MNNSTKVLDIISHNIPFRAKIVLYGDTYGLDNCLTHDKLNPLVEFYDQRYPHTADGQFISRYYVSTMNERDCNTGLCLNGGIPDWSIDAREMNLVQDWINSHPLLQNLPNDKQLKLKF